MFHYTLGRLPKVSDLMFRVNRYQNDEDYQSFRTFLFPGSGKALFGYDVEFNTITSLTKLIIV